MKKKPLALNFCIVFVALKQQSSVENRKEREKRKTKKILLHVRNEFSIVIPSKETEFHSNYFILTEMDIPIEYIYAVRKPNRLIPYTFCNFFFFFSLFFNLSVKALDWSVLAFYIRNKFSLISII